MSNVIDLNAKRKERDPNENDDSERIYIDAESMYHGIREVLETYDFVSHWSEESKKAFVDGTFNLMDAYAKSFTVQQNGFDYLMFTLEVLVRTYNNQVITTLKKEEEDNGEDS